MGLPRAEVNRSGPMPEPIQLSSVGERIPLPSGAIVERPNPLVIAHLQAADPRVRYYSTDASAFRIDVEPIRLHYKAVSKKIGERVRADFPDEDVVVRGSVATLTESSDILYWNRTWSLKEKELYPLTAIGDILARGSEDGGNGVVVDYISEEGNLNIYSEDWLSTHYGVITQQFKGMRLDDIFPVLLVYGLNAFKNFPDVGWNRLVGKPDERIAALYITDRVAVPDELNHF